MPIIQAADHITLSPSEIREQIKACEARAKLLREMLQIAERAQRVQHALSDAERPQSPRKNPTIVSIGPPNANGLRDAIRATRSTMQRFTVEKMRERLRAFPFGGAADPIKAIRDALYVLVKKGELRVVNKGKGGSPNVYEWQTAAKPATEAAS